MSLNHTLVFSPCTRSATDRAKLQAQLDALSNTQTSSSVEVQQLKQRVEETEREKRDLMGVVSRLQEDAAQRDSEIQTLRSDLKQARQDHQTLERQVRELTSAETSTKVRTTFVSVRALLKSSQFKLESLTQQLELAKSEAERSAAELAAKSEEFAKYRRTKHAELAQLQAAHDSLAQTHASTESSLKALQSAHTAQSHQLTQALTRIQDLKGQLAEQEATYSSEAAGLRRLVAMMEEREAQAKAIVDSIEKDFAGVGDRAERREAVLREEIENQKQRAEEAEKRVQELQAVLDRMDRGEFPVPSAFVGSISQPGTPARGMSTPARNGTSPDILSSGMIGLSPTVAMASRAQRGGKSFTEVYSDYIKLQDEYARKCAEYDHMDRTLSAVLAQIEERVSVIVWYACCGADRFAGPHPVATACRVRAVAVGVFAAGKSTRTGFDRTRRLCRRCRGERTEVAAEHPRESAEPEAARGPQPTTARSFEGTWQTPGSLHSV